MVNKTYWSTFTKTAVWILSIGGTFIVTPPLLSYANSSTSENLVRFLIAAVVSLMFIPLKKRSSKRYYPFWYKLAVISFFLTVAAIFYYSYITDTYAVRYYDKLVVIGTTERPDRIGDRKRTAMAMGRDIIDDLTYLKTKGGDPAEIWIKSQLLNRYYLMSLIYILTFLLVAFFIITTIQAISCYETKKKPALA